MHPLHPRQNIAGIANKAKTAIRQKPKITDSAVISAARSRAQAGLHKFQRLPIGASPVAVAFQHYLQDRLSNGEDIEDFVQEVKQRAEEEIDKRRHIVSALAEAMELCSSKDRLPRLRTDVLQPARARRINGTQAWDKVTEIFATPYPFLSWIERRTGPFTIGLAMQVEGGAGVGGGMTTGISGLRHCALGCYFQQYSVCVGAVAEAEIALQLSVSAGRPASGVSWGVETGAGGGVNATVSVTASFTPSLHRPSLRESWICDYEFDGLAVSIGGGGGLDIGVALGATFSAAL
ncbi:MAG: hypothetical protein GEV05_11730 [Betaproteobacteria bacterium]|nr:hypothetical protein [Betaproteobacteria bacterium]